MCTGARRGRLLRPGRDPRSRRMRLSIVPERGGTRSGDRPVRRPPRGERRARHRRPRLRDGRMAHRGRRTRRVCPGGRDVPARGATQRREYVRPTAALPARHARRRHGRGRRRRVPPGRDGRGPSRRPACRRGSVDGGRPGRRWGSRFQGGLPAATAARNGPGIRERRGARSRVVHLADRAGPGHLTAPRGGADRRPPGGRTRRRASPAGRARRARVRRRLDPARGAEGPGGRVKRGRNRPTRKLRDWRLLN